MAGSTFDAPQHAILLNGPTGSGKTPLGEWLQVHGLRGRRCRHFDFGAHLRAVASGRTADFTPEESRFVRGLLMEGALLEDQSFPLALRILQGFMVSGLPSEGELLVMNGLPRHLGQAEALAPHLRFVAVADLQCPAGVVWERLRRNSGGDRAYRSDDAVALVENKLRVFAERTRPLLAYYARLGVPVIHVPVDTGTRPSDIARILESAAFPLPGREPG